MTRFLVALVVMGSISVASARTKGKGSAFWSKSQARGVAEQMLRRKNGTFSGVDYQGKFGNTYKFGKATERMPTQDKVYVNSRTGEAYHSKR